MKIFLRFLYLNTYGFMLILGGLLIIALPFWLITVYTLIGQVVIGIIPIGFGISLISSWNDKKREYNVLMERNKNNFRPDTFEIYMDHPCGRKLTHAVLKDLGKSEEYKNLLIYKPTFKEGLRDFFKKPEVKLTYVNKEYLRNVREKAKTSEGRFATSAVFVNKNPDKSNQ